MRTHQDAEKPGAEAVEGELVLGGRHYRLVPIPEEPPVNVVATGPVNAAAAQLTTRERQVAELVAEGRVNKEIAAALGISAWTVSAHLRRIFAKLEVDTRAAMVSRWLRGGTGR